MAREEQLTVRAELAGTTCTLHLAGDLDLATADSFRKAVLEACDAGARDILLDLGELEFMDSTGLHTIVGLRDRVPVSVSVASAPVRRMFEITGVSMEHEGGGLHNGGSRPGGR